MAEIDFRVTRAEQDIKALQAEKKQLADAITALDKTVDKLNTTIEGYAEKEESRRKVITWAGAIFIGAFLTSAAQWVIRGGLGQ
jgi:ribosome-associated translation inhibitor RaiA